MPPVKLVLSVIATLSLSACSTTPSISPTIPPQPPQSCLMQCEPITSPLTGADLDIRRWEYQVVETYGQCRRLHNDCVTWVTR